MHLPCGSVVVVTARSTYYRALCTIFVICYSKIQPPIERCKLSQQFPLTTEHYVQYLLFVTARSSHHRTLQIVTAISTYYRALCTIFVICYSKIQPPQNIANCHSNFHLLQSTMYNICYLLQQDPATIEHCKLSQQFPPTTELLCWLFVICQGKITLTLILTLTAELQRYYASDTRPCYQQGSLC